MPIEINPLGNRSGEADMAAYRARIAEIHRTLQIPADYAECRGLPLQPEAASLGDIGTDLFGRPQQLAPDAAACWREMRQAAADDGVVLLVVSAFRSVDRQAEIIRRKLASGQVIGAILRVNAAPGYSEHHTGRALDLAAPDTEALSEAFEQAPAFAWLCRHAHRFGFELSYPRDNPWGISYEPWHWAVRPKAG